MRSASVALVGMVARPAEVPPTKHRPLSPFPELDCVRSLLPVAVIAAAEKRAAVIGVSAERVLIAASAISEEHYVTALAHHLGASFVSLDHLAREDCPFDDDALLAAPAVGMLPVRHGDDLAVVIAPRHQAARRLCLLTHGLPCRVYLTSSEQLQRFVDRHGGDAIARRAADEMKARHPNNSAAHRHFRVRASLVVTACLMAAATIVAPALVHFATAIFLGCVFFAWTALRLLATTVDDEFTAADLPPAEHELPDYTVIVALYREAAVVPQLVAALNAIEYPREKLDIKLVIEPDDVTTRAAILRLDLDQAYHVIVAPADGPRTKPKALNAALPFARGEYTAVFDAEDRPQPDQLRRAVARFHQSGPRLACVQGRLTIDNTADSWLTRLFTAEYCGLFDVLLPALAQWRLPLPLGGSSNHFRTAALRRAGAWDPHNVTEDADLGMRLSRLGYETSVIRSTTYEEAPGRLRSWLNQRTRWFKGWLQTWLVHMRAPMMLLNDLGFTGFCTFQLVVGGTVLAALVHPLFLLALTHGLVTGRLFVNDGNAVGVALAALYVATFVAGYVATVVLSFVGLSRRNLIAHAHVLVLVPVLWILLSIAAWRALIQLIYAPHRWDKTEHGLARTSRQRLPGHPVKPLSSSPRSAFG